MIRNLIKEPLQKRKANEADDDGDENSDSDKKKIGIRQIRTATDLQRLKLEKLMMNPDKPVVIPEQRAKKDYMAAVPNFVRNVMGSSAGAGSGEFHVYRHLRRKEYARQKAMQGQSAREKADEEFFRRQEENQRQAEEKTAKKRAKRQKKKERAKKARLGQRQKPVSEGVASEPPEIESSADESDREELAVPAEAVEVAPQTAEATSGDVGANAADQSDESTIERTVVDQQTVAIETQETSGAGADPAPIVDQPTTI